MSRPNRFLDPYSERGGGRRRTAAPPPQRGVIATVTMTPPPPAQPTSGILSTGTTSANGGTGRGSPSYRGDRSGYAMRSRGEGTTSLRRSSGCSSSVDSSASGGTSRYIGHHPAVNRHRARRDEETVVATVSFRQEEEEERSQPPSKTYRHRHHHPQHCHRPLPSSDGDGGVVHASSEAGRNCRLGENDVPCGKNAVAAALDGDAITCSTRSHSWSSTMDAECHEDEGDDLESQADNDDLESVALSLQVTLGPDGPTTGSGGRVLPSCGAMGPTGGGGGGGWPRSLNAATTSNTTGETCYLDSTSAFLEDLSRSSSSSKGAGGRRVGSQWRHHHKDDEGGNGSNRGRTVVAASEFTIPSLYDVAARAGEDDAADVDEGVYQYSQVALPFLQKLGNCRRRRGLVGLIADDGEDEDSACSSDVENDGHDGPDNENSKRERRRLEMQRLRMVQLRTSLVTFVLALLVYCSVQWSSLLRENRNQMERLREYEARLFRRGGGGNGGDNGDGDGIRGNDVVVGSAGLQQRAERQQQHRVGVDAFADPGAPGTNQAGHVGQNGPTGETLSPRQGWSEKSAGEDSRGQGPPSPAMLQNVPLLHKRPVVKGATTADEGNHNALPEVIVNKVSAPAFPIGTSTSKLAESIRKVYGNYADIFPPPEPGLLRQQGRPGGDTATFWQIHMAGGSPFKDIAGQCMGMTLASEVGAQLGTEEDQEVRVLEHKGSKYVNVDTTKPGGIEKAKRLNLASTGLADIIVTSRPHDLASLFMPDHRGRVFAVFRNPIDRALSMYDYHRGATWDPKYNPAVATMTVEEFAKSNKVENNWMTRFLTNEMTGEVTDDHLEVAKEILRTKVLVGLHGRAIESFHRFHRYFRWSLNDKDMGLQRLKCVRDLLTSPVDVNEHTVEEGSNAYKLLLWQNQYDMKLYKYVEEELFDAQAKFF